MWSEEWRVICIWCLGSDNLVHVPSESTGCFDKIKEGHNWIYVLFPEVLPELCTDVDRLLQGIKVILATTLGFA